MKVKDAIKTFADEAGVEVKGHYSVPEIASILGVDKKTVSRLIAKKRLVSFFATDRTQRIFHTDLAEYLRQQNQGAKK